eukprot:8138436-Alexandrium_andersonii.AAC.1
MSWTPARPQHPEARNARRPSGASPAYSSAQRHRSLERPLTGLPARPVATVWWQCSRSAWDRPPA